MRHIGVLLTAGEEPDYQARMAAFLNRLQQLGWTEGHNLRIDYRRSGSKSEDIRRDASELVALTPDVILTSGGTGLAQLLRATRIVREWTHEDQNHVETLCLFSGLSNKKSRGSTQATTAATATAATTPL